jgi:heme A synthase
MRAVGRVLVVGWLVAALLVLALDGRLPWFLSWTMPASLVALVLGALVRQQLAPSRYCRPPLPDRYRVADDVARPLAEVVAAAEAEASAGSR